MLTCFITSSGQGAPHHQTDPQTGYIKSLEVGVVQRGDEHRRHAVERGAPFTVDGLERCSGIEDRRGQHHRGPSRDAAQTAQDHAAAVVEGKCDAQPVLLGEAQVIAEAQRIVQDRVVRQRCAFRKASRPGRVLDVDRAVELLFALTRCELRRFHLVADGQDVIPVVGARHVLPAEGDHAAKVRQAFRVQSAGLGA